jgi:dienelactone hydrolase
VARRAALTPWSPEIPYPFAVTYVAPLEYRVDGVEMIGLFARPDGAGPFPAVLIAHGAPGLDAYCRTRPEALADAGYAALAIDYHGGGRVFSDPDELAARFGVLAADPVLVRSLASAGLSALLSQSSVDAARVAALGYCFGAVVVMELARTGADLKAVVGLHPGLGSLTPNDTANVVGRVLMCVGADDPLAPPSERSAFEAEMNAAGVDWQMNLYGGAKHRFTDPNAGTSGNPALAYHRDAAERSWRAALDHFEDALS